MQLHRDPMTVFVVLGVLGMIFFAGVGFLSI